MLFSKRCSPFKTTTTKPKCKNNKFFSTVKYPVNFGIFVLYLSCVFLISFLIYIAYLNQGPSKVYPLWLVDVSHTSLPVGSFFSFPSRFFHAIFCWRDQIICLLEFPIALILPLCDGFPPLFLVISSLDLGAWSDIRFWLFVVGLGGGTERLHRWWCLLLSGKFKVWWSFLWY